MKTIASYLLSVWLILLAISCNNEAPQNEVAQEEETQEEVTRSSGS